MKSFEIPLITQSLPYAMLVDAWVKSGAYSKYRHKILVNFCTQYNLIDFSGKDFGFDTNYDYAKNKSFSGEPFDDRLLDARLGGGSFLKVLLKCVVHTAFRVIGNFSMLYQARNFHIVRKCFVEDVESLFDETDNVLRLVFPFPMSVIRQLSYLKYLVRSSIPFRLDGLHYSYSDLVKFCCRRSYRNLLRLESRASLRYAIALGGNYRYLRTVQCSDEYDYFSFVFSRYFQRKNVLVHNSAHGVGKYLPYHSYGQFDVLTKAQLDYYREFNVKALTVRPIASSHSSSTMLDALGAVVLLGQQSSNRYSYISDSEHEIIQVLGKLSLMYDKIRFYYKPHPNLGNALPFKSKKISVIKGRLCSKNPRKCIFYFSLYSTCQIDNSFVGNKMLIETNSVNPRFVYGEYEPIVRVEELESYLKPYLDDLSGELLKS